MPSYSYVPVMVITISAAARMVALVSLYVASFGNIVSALEVWQKPRRCCSPDQWEADVRNLGTTTRSRDPEMKLTAKFSYDYTNKRWAFDYRDESDRRNHRRVVFDHQKDIKFAVTSKGCYAVPLNMPSMDRYCVPANASHHGFFDYGLNREMVGYDVWSYDMMYIPVRVIMKVSRDECLPLKDASLSLIRNRWQWKDGEPVCVPWQFPEQASNGECFRSHVAHKIERTGTVASGALYNMDFRNINLTISNENIFHFPTSCQHVDDWPGSVSWHHFWNFLITRMKMN